MSKIIRVNPLFAVFSLMIVLSIVLSVSAVSAEQSGLPRIKVTLLNQDPDPVEQNDVVDVRFKVENEGAETKDDVFIQIIPEYPFALYSGNLVQDVGKLRADQTGADALIVRYKLKVDKYAQKGDNEVKLQIKIGEGLWQSYTDNDFFVNVKDYNVPGITAYLKDATINKAGEKGTVTIEVANADKADVKFLQLTLLPSQGYQIVSPSNYAYIGDVSSDDTQTEDFEIYTDKNAKGEIILPVSLKYQDTNDKKYEDTFSLKLRVYDSSELKMLGLSKTNYSSYVIGGLIIAAILIVFWRSRRKK